MKAQCSFILCPLFDPLFDEGALCFRERLLLGLGRRHHLVGIVTENPLPQF